MKRTLFFLTLLFSSSVFAEDKISIKDKDLMSLLGSYSKAAAMKHPAQGSAKETTVAPTRTELRSPRQDFRKNFKGPTSPTAPQAPRLE